MNYADPAPITPSRSPNTVFGEWYLFGFEDAYRGRLAIIPSGPAGEQYKKGYTDGLAAAQRDFFAATWN